jgi:hypothetical protein
MYANYADSEPDLLVTEKKLSVQVVEDSGLFFCVLKNDIIDTVSVLRKARLSSPPKNKTLNSFKSFREEFMALIRRSK